ncbi:MAG: hypothetical protein ACQGVC_04035 [Myxococcota bacterium]
MTDSPDSRAGHLLWIAPLLAIAGFFSYFGFFVRWPVLRDTGALNLVVLLAALALSVVALRRGWPGGVGRRIAGVLGVLVSTLLLAGFVGYLYFLSYQLPATDGVVEVGEPLPAVTLAAHDGSSLALGEAGDGPLVLVFYRGHW